MVVIQYLSVFIGLVLSTMFVESVYDGRTAQQIVLLIAGSPDGASYDTDLPTICLFIGQSFLYLLIQHYLSEFQFSRWTQGTFKCAVKHYLMITPGAMHAVCNPNYAVDSAMFHKRLNVYDAIALLLPWITLSIWNWLRPILWITKQKKAKQE